MLAMWFFFWNVSDWVPAPPGGSTQVAQEFYSVPDNTSIFRS